MALPPPLSEAPIASPGPNTSALEVNAFVDEADTDSNASESEESTPAPPNERNQPKMTPRAIRKRRRRNDNRAFKKSLQDISSGTRLARQRRDQFNYQQKQNRAWLQHQVQLPSRGGVPRHAEVELQAFFRKDTPADPITNLPMLGNGKSLSLDAQAAWEKLKEERETVRVAMGIEFTPAWFVRGNLSAVRRTKGEKRAATRERKSLVEEGASLFEGLGLGEGDKEVKEEGQLMEVDGEDNDEGGVKVV